MVKCNNCGINVSDDLENCPNCGNNLVNIDETQISSLDIDIKCENCGLDLHENVLFCPTCGSKVSFPKKIIQTKTCPNCGTGIGDDVEFCPECGINIRTGVKTKHKSLSNSSENKINLENIIKPSIMALIVSVILSLIGLLIGFSWFSFIIAIILTVGFLAGTIDNEVNAMVFGLFVGLILGILENSLVEFIYGIFVARFYESFIGGHLIILVILGVIVAYISNTFLKETIGSIITKFKVML
ncbi:MAG: zinc ribbon domain-containing protein [Methanobrevibacter sp.]|uniref:zinc ribbon domain-containing protein n=1 Tax=Methanobrevibacter sp. TaxID=66852 RepID=UPI003F0AE5D7